MADFDPGWPSARQIQGYIQDKQQVEVKLVTGDVLTGRVFWQDPVCICLLQPDDTQISLWRLAIAYHKPVSAG